MWPRYVESDGSFFSISMPSRYQFNSVRMANRWPKVMHARSRTIARAPQTNLTRQTPEDAMNILMQQWTALFRNEEMGVASRG